MDFDTKVQNTWKNHVKSQLTQKFVVSVSSRYSYNPTYRENVLRALSTIPARYKQELSKCWNDYIENAYSRPENQLLLGVTDFFRSRGFKTSCNYLSFRNW